MKTNNEPANTVKKTEYLTSLPKPMWFLLYVIIHLFVFGYLYNIEVFGSYSQSYIELVLLPFIIIVKDPTFIMPFMIVLGLVEMYRRRKKQMRKPLVEYKYIRILFIGIISVLTIMIIVSIINEDMLMLLLSIVYLLPITVYYVLLEVTRKQCTTIV